MRTVWTKVVLLAILAILAFSLTVVAAQDVPATYDLGGNYQLQVFQLDFSRVNHGQMLRIVPSGSQDPAAVLLTEEGTLQVNREQQLDTPNYQVWVVLVESSSLLGGRSDPCLVHLPTGNLPVLATCR